MMRTRRSSPGLTLIELVVVIAVAGVLLTLAAPSFRDFILVQRLKGVNAQLVTDLQFARSEAAARGKWMRLVFTSNETTSCYTIFVTTGDDNAERARCDCTRGPGEACSAIARLQEVRTATVPRSQGVIVAVQLDATLERAFAFDHISGGLVNIPTDRRPQPRGAFTLNASIDERRVLRTVVSAAGRPSVCAPVSLAVGAPACP